MNPTATLSWLGSSHAKCSYITFHKKSDFCQLLRTPSPKCVKLLRRFKGQKDLIFFPSLEMSHQTEFLNIHSFQKEGLTPMLLGRTWKSHQLPHGTSQHWNTFEFVWHAVAQITLVTQPALLSLQTSHIQMELCKHWYQQSKGQWSSKRDHCWWRCGWHSTGVLIPRRKSIWGLDLQGYFGERSKVACAGKSMVK